jgi:hypothetical protein
MDWKLRERFAVTANSSHREPFASPDPLSKLPHSKQN